MRPGGHPNRGVVPRRVVGKGVVKEVGQEMSPGGEQGDEPGDEQEDEQEEGQEREAGFLETAACGSRILQSGAPSQAGRTAGHAGAGDEGQDGAAEAGQLVEQIECTASRLHSSSDRKSRSNQPADRLSGGKFSAAALFHQRQLERRRRLP